jgi:hypothetical protein
MKKKFNDYLKTPEVMADVASFDWIDKDVVKLKLDWASESEYMFSIFSEQIRNSGFDFELIDFKIKGNSNFGYAILRIK